jgi:hypothetical protein
MHGVFLEASPKDAKGYLARGTWSTSNSSTSGINIDGVENTTGSATTLSATNSWAATIGANPGGGSNYFTGTLLLLAAWGSTTGTDALSTANRQFLINQTKALLQV